MQIGAWLKERSANGKTGNKYGDRGLEVRPDDETNLLHGEISAGVVQSKEDDQSYDVECACAIEMSVSVGSRIALHKLYSH